MKRLVSLAYFNGVFAERDYQGLVWLASMLSRPQVGASSGADYGLPRPMFLLVEGLAWFAQSARSGAWTYFESTPVPRQRAMHEALSAEAPQSFAERYAQGMRGWRNETEMADLDDWIESADETNNKWLWTIAEKNRSSLDRLVCY